MSKEIFLAEMGEDHQVDIDEFMAENFGVAEAKNDELPEEEPHLAIMLEFNRKEEKQ